MTWRVRSASTCRPLPPNRGRGRLGWASAFMVLGPAMPSRLRWFTFWNATTACWVADPYWPSTLRWSPGRAVAGSANARGLGRVAAAPGTAWAGPLPAWPNPWAAWPDPWAAWPDPGPAMPPEVAVAELLVAGVVVATPAAVPV